MQQPDTHKQLSVCIVIVNYRTAELTLNCLESIFNNENGDLLLSAIIADNNSNDGSVEHIGHQIQEQDWGAWASILSLKKNGGFAYGNNQILEKIISTPNLPDFFWLLNPDTIIHKHAVKTLADFLQQHPEVGIAGSRLENPDGTPQVSAFRDHSVLSEFLTGMRLGIFDSFFSKKLVSPPRISEIPHQTDWVSGASMMVRGEVFQQIGLLDEHFFMYYEEVDFCIRARRAGWSCWYVPESRVIHLVGAASGISSTRKELARRPPYWFDSRRRFFIKNYGRLTLFLADSAWLIGFGIWRIRQKVQGKTDRDPPHYFKDFFSHSVFRKGFVR